MTKEGLGSIVGLDNNFRGEKWTVPMASIKLGGLIIEIRGSIAGNTFARNRSGNYVRAKTTPINPNTARQQGVRGAMAFLTARWSTDLTALQRTAWNLYGASVTMLNRLGENINLSGFNHYLRSNMIRKQTALALIDDGPTLFEIPEKDPTLSLASSAATQQLTIGFDNSLAWANEDGAFMHLFQGTPQNGQRNFFDGPWRFIGQIAGDGTTAPTSPELLGVNFAIAAGQRLWIYARIGRADGRLSQRFRRDSIVGV